MTGHHIIAAGAAFALSLTLAAPAGAQGSIDVVQQGRYVCELPGDAAGPHGIEQPERGFRIENASRYSSAAGSGTYLRRGDRLTFTSGPRQGEAYQVVSDARLRRLENGTPGRLRCIRQER